MLAVRFYDCATSRNFRVRLFPHFPRFLQRRTSNLTRHFLNRKIHRAAVWSVFRSGLRFHEFTFRCDPIPHHVHMDDLFRIGFSRWTANAVNITDDLPEILRTSASSRPRASRLYACAVVAHGRASFATFLRRGRSVTVSVVFSLASGISFQC